MPRVLPMFPLGGVLFPDQVLPLHVFEPRYRKMLRHCLQNGREFGVVLIERGHEVGGGDVRSNIGTIARVLRAAELEGNHSLIVTVGTDRICVREWLPDDPWPQARIEEFPDRPESRDGADAVDAVDGACGADPADGTDPAEPDDSVAERWPRVQAAFRRVLGAAAELNGAAPRVDVEIADDPAAGSFHVAALSPLGAFDRQRVLSVPTVAGRLRLLEEQLADLELLIQAGLTFDLED